MPARCPTSASRTATASSGRGAAWPTSPDHQQPRDGGLRGRGRCSSLRRRRPRDPRPQYTLGRALREGPLGPLHPRPRRETIAVRRGCGALRCSTTTRPTTTPLDEAHRLRLEPARRGRPGRDPLRQRGFTVSLGSPVTVPSNPGRDDRAVSFGARDRPTQGSRRDQPTSPDTSIDAAHYRNVLGTSPTGVTVITGTSEGNPIGMAIGSFSSVSLDPPLVLFCPRRPRRAGPHRGLGRLLRQHLEQRAGGRLPGDGQQVGRQVLRHRGGRGLGRRS